MPPQPVSPIVLVADPLGVIGDVLVPVLTHHVECHVIHVRSVAEIQSLIRRGARGQLAMVSTGFGGDTAPLIQALVAAGWTRVLTLASELPPEPLLADILGAGAQGVVRVICDERGLQPIDKLLSVRELQVIRLVAEGFSNRLIGRELGLSPLTVKNHLARIGRKLGTGDRARMVAIAFRSGLIN